MMKNLKSWPSALLRRWLLQTAAGVGCLLLGVVMFLAVWDKVFLIISILLAGWIFLRCILFYRTVAGRKYDTVDGICIGKKCLPFQKVQTIFLREDNGREHTFLIECQAKIENGCCYRVYAQRNDASDVRVLAIELSEPADN